MLLAKRTHGQFFCRFFDVNGRLIPNTRQVALVFLHRIFHIIPLDGEKEVDVSHFLGLGVIINALSYFTSLQVRFVGFHIENGSHTEI